VANHVIDASLRPAGPAARNATGLLPRIPQSCSSAARPLDRACRWGFDRLVYFPYPSSAGDTLLNGYEIYVGISGMPRPDLARVDWLQAAAGRLN